MRLQARVARSEALDALLLRKCILRSATAFASKNTWMDVDVDVVLDVDRFFYIENDNKFIVGRHPALVAANRRSNNYMYVICLG